MSENPLKSAYTEEGMHVTEKCKSEQLQAWLDPGAQMGCQASPPLMSSGLLFLQSGRTVVSSSRAILSSKFLEFFFPSGFSKRPT